MQALIFDVPSGKLYANGSLIGLAYSGHGDGVNNQAMEGVRDVGPIPRGFYDGTLTVNPKLGPRIFLLNPDPANDMKGRSGFLIHWDNHDQNFTASEGCIVPISSATFPRIDNQFRLEVK